VRTGNYINWSGMGQRFENKKYRNEKLYCGKIIDNRVLELIVIVLNGGTGTLEGSLI
jgi:hypothetical protein